SSTAIRCQRPRRNIVVGKELNQLPLWTHQRNRLTTVVQIAGRFITSRSEIDPRPIEQLKHNRITSHHDPLAWIERDTGAKHVCRRSELPDLKPRQIGRLGASVEQFKKLQILVIGNASMIGWVIIQLNNADAENRVFGKRKRL